MAYIRILMTLAFLLQSALSDDRIKDIFEKYPDAFSAGILLEVFREDNGQEEFLLNESNALTQELVTEFDDLLQVGIIGYTLEDRPLQVLSFKGMDEDAPAVLIDGLHHAREIATVKMTFGILLR